MRYAYRTPKLYNLSKLLKMFRESGISYSTLRFKGERANRFFTLLTVALDESKWETLQGGIRIKGTEISFPDVRFTKQNYKRYKSYMEEIKADFFTDQEHRPYKENRVHVAQELLMVSVLEDQAGPRRISDPFKDWGIRTDRLLKAKVIQLKRAEGEPLEKNMDGVSIEDVSANLSDTQDQAVEENFIRPLIEKQRVSDDLIDQKIADFEGHPSKFQGRLLKLKTEVSSNGKTYGEELNRLMLDTSLSFAGSTLEQYVVQHQSLENEVEVKEPDFIGKMRLDRQSAMFHPSGRKRNQNKARIALKELHERYKKDLKEYLELNSHLGISFETYTNPKYRGRHDSQKFFNDTRLAIKYVLEKKQKSKKFHVKGLETKFRYRGYAEDLKKLKSIVGSHSEIDQQIEEYSQSNDFYGRIPQSILDLNKTQTHLDQLNLERQTKEALVSLTPVSSKDFTYEKKSNEYTSPQYPHLTLYIRGRSIPHHTSLRGAFFALNVVHIYTGATYMNFEYTKESRASYNPPSKAWGAKNGLVKIARENATQRVWIHEVIHAIEFLNPKINNLVNAFYASRFEPKNYKLFAKTRLNGKEMAFSGLWALYAGKFYDYNDGDQASEMITMGVQEFRSTEDIIAFAKKDYAHFLFCHALVTGKLKEYL